MRATESHANERSEESLSAYHSEKRNTSGSYSVIMPYTIKEREVTMGTTMSSFPVLLRNVYDRSPMLCVELKPTSSKNKTN